MPRGSLNTISWPPSTHSDLANLDDAPIVILNDARHLESATPSAIFPGLESGKLEVFDCCYTHPPSMRS
jgi:hypothetical protein